MPQPTTTTPARSAARVVALVAGTLLGLVAAGLLVAGGVVLWGDAQKDDDGYVSTASDRFATSTYAVATENLDIDLEGAGWIVDADRYGKLRLTVQGEGRRPVFAGIAPTSDVSAYLRGVAYDSVADLSYRPFQVEYRSHDGDRRPAPPIEQRFWSASTHGSGSQSLTWDVQDGDWSVVVMNADGSRGVVAGVSAGARVPFLTEIGWGSIGGGAVLLLAAAGLIVFAARTPRRAAATPAASLGVTPAAG